MGAALADDLVAVIIVGLAMLVPIIAVMTSHQRKMAELYRGDQATQTVVPQLAAENEQLKKELAEMKAMLYQQAIAIDDMQSRGKESADISQRLENTP